MLKSSALQPLVTTWTGRAARLARNGRSDLHTASLASAKAVAREEDWLVGGNLEESQEMAVSVGMRT